MVSEAALAPREMETLFCTYRGKVLSYACHHLGNLQDAEDAASQVFLRVQEKWHTYDAARGAVSTWIYAITRNEVRDALRRRAREPGGEENLEALPARDLTPEEALSARARLEDLEAALEKLPERERDIVVLRFYSGLLSREVAARMGLSDGNVRYLQTKALRKLRAMMA